MGWILNGFGTQDPTQQALEQIENQLTEMNQELATIQTGINNLTNMVTQLMPTVNLEWANLVATYDSLNMSNEETVIQNQYQNLQTNFTTSNPNVCTAAGSNAAMLFAHNILSASAYDIDQQIYNMYAQMTGQYAECRLLPGMDGQREHVYFPEGNQRQRCETAVTVDGGAHGACVVHRYFTDGIADRTCFLVRYQLPADQFTDQ